jgi:hypothetical protein
MLNAIISSTRANLFIYFGVKLCFLFCFAKGLAKCKFGGI